MSVIIFYNSDVEEEILKATERYFRFLGKETKIIKIKTSVGKSESEKKDTSKNNKEQSDSNLTSIDPSEYFNLCYPRKYDNCEIYLLFGKDLDQFDNKNLTPTGFLFSILMDMSLSKDDFSYKLFGFQPDIDDFMKANRIKLSNSEEKSTERKCPAPVFEEIDKLFIESNDSLIQLMTHHAHDENIKKESLIRINSLSEIATKKDSSDSKSADKKNDIFSEKSKDLVNNSVFVMIVDDVVGDYGKTFFPFYVLMKSKLKRNNKDLIMRGVADPVKLKDYFDIFPADIILVDIDFKEKAEQWKEKSGLHYYYYAEGPEIAGIRIFEQLFYLRAAGSLFLKKSNNFPKLILFTGVNFQKEGDINNVEKIGCSYIFKNAKMDNLMKELNSFIVDENYYFTEIEDAFKKLVYLKRNKKTDEQDKIISLIILRSEKDFESDLVKENWDYFNSIIKNIKKVYTGLEPFDEPIFDIKKLNEKE